MKKFLKIMCLASLSVLSAGSIFGVIYHQHNSNLVKREDKSVNDKEKEDESENSNHNNNDSNNETDKENENDDEKLIIDDKPENQNINYDTKVEEKEKQEAIARKEFEDILNNSNKADTEVIESLVNDTKQELTVSYKKAVYNEDATICKEIGFFKNDKGEIQIEKMPETVKEVPSKLPWQINSLENAFYENKNIKIKNLEKWNLQFVKNIDMMFYKACLFNQNINNWDTSNIVSMKGTFHWAEEFNQPLNNWNTSKVTNMKEMFHYAKKFNQPLNSWDVSNVESMQSLFDDAISFNQDLNNWNVSNVDNMLCMFNNAYSFNKDISSWIFKNLKTTAFMFYNAYSYNNGGVHLKSRKIKKSSGDTITSWDLSSVESMAYMFHNTPSFCQDISNWNVKKASTVCFLNRNSGNWREPNWSNNIPKVIRDRYSNRKDEIVS
ncbi:BspA family leucine-rich repeat surface protein [Mycoplasma cottewii]|uniref:BspA family leucine-rich repeat surface protein n=1 Tax=Mycoplasma cottewii TaxID=51364 RepID=A0ABY5U269_9MOLU|nr:BspA family leucine-rich repeat surface protein [Mycoplasma cottewii]UWD35379.1 BspA family leucine-rich repeat surface protein [Mycoplasma cottewii]